jgi:hypothetical protein
MTDAPVDVADVDVAPIGVLEAVFEVPPEPEDDDFEKKYAIPMRIIAPIMMIAMI